MTSEPNLTLYRLAVNAIYEELKHDRWRGPTSWRDLNDHGSRPPFKAIASAKIPKAPALDARIRQTQELLLVGTIHPDERAHLTEPTYVILTREDYDRIMAIAPSICLHDLRKAIRGREPAPYAWWINGRKETHLHRNYAGWLTPPVYGLLHHLTNAAKIILSNDTGTAEQDARNPPIDALAAV